MIRIPLPAIAVLLLSLFATSVYTQTLPFRYKLNHLTGFSSPIFLTHAKDGSRRLFVVQQGGIIKVIQPGSTTSTDFMNITTRVLSGGERGLLGLAFHPNFATNHYFFVYYTRQTDGQTMVSRFTAINNNSIGDPNSERVVLGPMFQPNSNHNGGMIEFREDSPGVHNLYIAKGDGGSGNDPDNRAQTVTDILGKILRITPDVSGIDTSPPYTVPSDNPYVGINGADEIYAIGMRNPWRFSFDRGGTNQLWLGDVGQGTWEEVDIITRGGNYGWKVCEGAHLRGSTTELCTNPAFTNPVFEYSSNPSRCSVTGGYVYRGGQRALPLGTYVYADYCTGEILSWNGSSQSLLLDTSRSIVSFGEDEDGELYVVGHGGTIDKIIGNRTSADFDGDLKVDQAVFRPSDSFWYIRNSSNGQTSFQQWGNSTDIPTPEDFDGDGKADIAVFRPSTGVWWTIRSADSVVTSTQFGANGDIPSAADFDGDGTADMTVFRPLEGNWYSRRSTDLAWTVFHWGAATDVPVPSDYDGDNRADLAIWRPTDGNWWVINSTTGNFSVVQWGANGDIPVTGDYNGDSRSDFMVFRPSDGFFWYLRRNVTFDFQITQWGAAGDIPAAGDYDGDMIDDIAVFRPSSGQWFYVGSTTGSQVLASWGGPGDKPAPAFDTP